MRQSKISAIQKKLIDSRRSHFKDFRLFRKYYFPDYNRLPDAKFHTELSDCLSYMSLERGIKYAIAAPRESAKSTIVTLEYVVYCICYKLEDFIVIISSTADQAVSFLSNIKQELEKNTRLIQDFPEVCEIGKKPNPLRWTQKEIITKNSVSVLALGTGQQMRGRKNREHRPSLIILDDVETDESFQTPENYDKLNDWLTKAVLKAGTSTTNVVYVGTIHHYSSLLYQFTSPDAHQGWEKRIYRSIISWSSHPELWEKWILIFNNKEEYKKEQGPEAAQKYYEAHKEKMFKGTEVLWPENKSYYALMVMREQDGYISFDSEMQNEPVNPRDCYFNLDDVHYWDDKYTEEELLSIISDNCKFFGACDPSMGKQNRNSDFSAIVTGVVDTKSKTIYILDADIERRKPHKTIEDILAHHSKRKYKKFGFESNQFQELMADDLSNRAQEAGNPLVVEKIQHSTDKLGRIQSLQPFIKNGSIQFSKSHRTLLEQMKFFPKGSHDDGLDALEMVFQLCKDFKETSKPVWINIPSRVNFNYERYERSMF